MRAARSETRKEESFFSGWTGLVLELVRPDLTRAERAGVSTRILGKPTRDAARNKERWKRRRTPTQDPGTDLRPALQVRRTRRLRPRLLALVCVLAATAEGAAHAAERRVTRQRREIRADVALRRLRHLLRDRFGRMSGPLSSCHIAHRLLSSSLTASIA